MQRHAIRPRPDWESRLEAAGVTFHTHDDGSPYWREDAYYAFSPAEVARFERAAAELQAMCLKAVEHVLDRGRFREYGIPPWMEPVIRESWDRDEVGLYGRFDFAYDGQGFPKLLEYNADTPTSLVEAAVAQWYWLEERFPGRDQFNSLHERLVAAWKRAQDFLPAGTLYFLHQDTLEDQQTVAYLRDTADQAGFSTAQMLVEDLGWDGAKGGFCDLDQRPVRAAFKLYPWEFMVKDEFGAHLARQPRPCAFLEPAWKMLLSNKALLAILWELFPGSPYLLPAYLDGPRDLANYVKKPILAREGANVEIHAGGAVHLGKAMDCYGAEGFVHQAYAPIPEFDGYRPVLGAWIVDGEPAGMGIREARGPITDNGSSFVPHLIEG
ncbi:glutathionylspermidine synthase family protein [Mesoterricola silvestris]|uniref:Glutathionylspermidine synthase n=1 Tax=Mesoterricola silvestris TaxID=2927979 RepID=A0AA48K7J7_9BACT|nr:glutathionylspermidine synthase family protein [Mesoterricola silvestris]BDU71196.1 putative glutathionylspermidine synthase [Mesoterricola silvestris]